MFSKRKPKNTEQKIKRNTLPGGPAPAEDADMDVPTTQRKNFWPARKRAEETNPTLQTYAPDEKNFFWQAMRANDVTEVARMLDKNPAAVSWRDENGNLPLVSACWPTTRNADMAALLITHGANANDPHVFAAATARGEDIKIIDMLFNNGYVPSQEDFLHAACANAPHALKKCVVAGIDVNTTDAVKKQTSIRFPGATALHYAAMYAGNDMRIIDILLDLNANIDARDKDGRTPLMRAISHGQTSAAIKLAQSGAKMKIRDKELSNAFSIARRTGNFELRKTLIAIEKGNQKPFLDRFKKN